MKNYFELLGLPQTFAVDLVALEDSYQALSQIWHPDRIGQKTSQSRTEILLRSAELNQAYQTLKDEQRRAHYLLRLHGVDIKEDQGSFASEDPDFLMEVLDFQERMLQAKDANETKKIASQLQDEIRKVLQSISVRFSLLSQQKEKELPLLIKEVSRLRFYHRLLENVSSAENE